MINRRDQLKTTDGKSGLRWLYDYPVWSLSTLFAMAITVLMWNVFTVSHALTVDGAIRYAEQYLESLDKFRSAYSSEVVNRVKKAGIKVSADYRMHDNQIPFPATFSLILARSINAGNSGVKTNLYSSYPWPWRSDGGPGDDFESKALAQLQHTPEEPVIQVESAGGVSYLRYARAVIMKESCVSCHNSHPNSPKKDWHEGDVRGVQSVSLPLPSELSVLSKHLSSTAIIMVVSAAIFIFLLALVVRELRASLRRVSQFAEETESANLALTRTNTAFSRFVPHEFLSFLRKEKIIDVKLGDNAQKEMTVLFSDIRDFTTISERLSPEENFVFINNYLSTMGPVVRENGGFIDKYIGDAIMALFDGADAALDASIEMLRRLDGFNQREANNDSSGISIGIGLNTGHLMLGTVGEANRMEGTVISDAVNQASRIEGLTKDYQAPLLISETTLRRIKHIDRYCVRLMGCVRVKGKRDFITIYEIFDADPDDLRQSKKANAEKFSQAVKYYIKEQYTEAAALFTECHDSTPEDVAAKTYLARCKKMQQKH